MPGGARTILFEGLSRAVPALRSTTGRRDRRRHRRPGRSLDIETTAEGVETFEQLIFLRTAGCKLAQGYFFSRPVPARDLSFDCAPTLPNDAKVA
jgi:hypothetical protein